MIVDIHAHAYPDKIAARAVESLESTYEVEAHSDGTVSGLLARMAESGVDVSVINAVSTAARQVISINDWISGIYKISVDSREPRFPLIGFGTIHPEFEDYRNEIQRMKELGIIGIKFQSSFQEFYPDDEKMYPIYEEIIKVGMIMLFHAGDEIKPAETVYATPPRLARALDAMQSEIDNCDYRVRMEDGSRGPIKIIAAHLGGYMMWDEVEEYLLGRDIYLDDSYVLGHLDTARAVRMMRSHGFDKILFGTDSPFARQEEDIAAIMRLDVTQNEKEKILGGNAMQLLDIG